MSAMTRGRAVAAMSLGGLLFGFDTAVVSGVTEALTRAYGLSAAGLGIAVSAALWGTLAGAMGSGAPGDRWGSVAVLRLVGLCYVASAIGCAVATTLPVFVAFRFLGGLAIGASSVLVPVYIAEVSAPAKRGLMVGLFQFNVVFGILAAYLSNFVIGQWVDPAVAWRWKLGVAGFPAAVFLLLLARLPQSPRWLAARGRGEAASVAARQLGLPDVPSRAAAGDARLSWRRHRTPLLLAIAIGLFNQLSGINAILYYLNDIFAAAGFRGMSGDLQAIAIGAANLVATLVGMAIIDRIGRRPLLIGGGIVTAVALAGVALVYAGAASATLLLPLLMLFIAAFAMSQGAVIWVYLSEIFPTDVRARGQAVGSATHWIANAVLSFAFPLLAQHSRVLPFAFFALAMLLQALLVWRLFPETRGRELETISADLAPAAGSAGPGTTEHGNRLN